MQFLWTKITLHFKTVISITTTLFCIYQQHYFSKIKLMLPLNYISKHDKRDWVTYNGISAFLDITYKYYIDTFTN